MSEYGIEGLTEQEVNDFMEAITDSNGDLLPNSVARIDVVEVDGHVQVMVSLREGMTGEEFASMLHSIADGFESGTAQQMEIRP